MQFLFKKLKNRAILPLKYRKIALNLVVLRKIVQIQHFNYNRLWIFITDYQYFKSNRSIIDYFD